MNKKNSIGGVIQTYIKYDPQKFPSPTQPPPDFVSPLMDQMLAYGSTRELTGGRAGSGRKLDPSQFKNLGPSIDQMMAILEERKRQILETYETRTVKETARRQLRKQSKSTKQLAEPVRTRIQSAIQEEQLYDLERIYWSINDDTAEETRIVMNLMLRLGEKYQIDELAAKYTFTGDESMTVPQAIEIKDELEKIDELLKQLEQARETAQIAIIDMEQLGEFMDQDSMHSLEEMQRMIENYVKEAAEKQGLSQENGRFQLTQKPIASFKESS